MVCGLMITAPTGSEEVARMAKPSAFLQRMEALAMDLDRYGDVRVVSVEEITPWKQEVIELGWTVAPPTQLRRKMDLEVE